MLRLQGLAGMPGQGAHLPVVFRRVGAAAEAFSW
jgi:hypothetical protein